jgi:acetylornithine deacetylase/succinyl-diaminopimelate desuccinylase-like protein
MCPDPVAILQNLVRFDTTNPPGDEAPCMAYISQLMRDAGIEPTILARDERRPNLLARLPGRGEASPILLYGHVDVVPVSGQTWTHPPFCGEIIEGQIWGRGTLDMKGGVAMMICAFLRAWGERARPPRDVILAVLSDEEVDGEFGARFLVDRHPEYFEGVRYAIGEGGGYSAWIAGRKFYPIMVAEKQFCALRATVSGPAGHGSIPARGGTMAKLAQVLRRIDRHRLPVHITPVTQEMLRAIARALPFPAGAVFRLLLTPVLTDRILDLLGRRGELLNPLLHNTVSPTIVRGGEAINVIPGQVKLELDGRLLPGFTPHQALRELGQLLGPEVMLEVTHYNPGPPPPDMSQFGTLADILREIDPQGIPIPYLSPAVTDGRHFARLGIQTYGFLPVDLPDGLTSTIHAADERIPVTAVGPGAEAVYQVIQRLGASTEGHPG